MNVGIQQSRSTACMQLRKATGKPSWQRRSSSGSLVFRDQYSITSTWV